MLGGLISGLIAGRVSFSIDRVPQVSIASRLGLAFIGGNATVYLARNSFNNTS